MNRTFRPVIPTINIPVAEYSKFYLGMRRETQVPPVYEAWIRQTVHSEQELKAAGMGAERIEVYWDDFEEFGHEVRLPLTFMLLKVYTYNKWLRSKSKC